ncbi:MAG TPA: hypothetical protein VIY73_20370 [Polyangiaceae bacterium]
MTQPVHPSTYSANASSASGVDPNNALTPATVVGMSPDVLLAYAGNMMNSMNTQIDDMMNIQQEQVNEQQVLGNLQNQLGAFNPAPTAAQLPEVYQDYQTAIAALPPDSSAAINLQKQCATFASSCVSAAQFNGNGSVQAPDGSGAQWNEPSTTAWQQTTTSVGDLSGDVKNNAQLQFLQLQDLCSQQQDAVEQITNMMSKQNDTLLDQAKALGA